MPDALGTKAWTKSSLAECCSEIAIRIDNPAESGFDRFVGLEHLATGESSIHSWGSTADVSSSMKLFKEGDVIVARRNVYLRRAARAGFDGVCSGDGIVLRGNVTTCLPELLPFLLNTDGFWDYVTSQADGTMSKRITVKRLLAYKVSLPPIDDQRRIAEALRAAEANVTALRRLGYGLATLRAAAIDELTFGLSATRSTVGAHCEMQNGRPFPGSEYCDEGELLLRPGNLDSSGYLTWGEGSTRRVPRHYRQEASDFVVAPGDVLINLTAQSLEDGFMGRVCLVRDGDESLLNQRIGRFRQFSEQLLPEFLFRVLQSSMFRRHAVSMCEGSKIKHLFWQHIEHFEFPLPSTSEQARIIEALKSIDAAVTDTALRLKAASELSNQLLRAALRDKVGSGV